MTKRLMLQAFVWGCLGFAAVSQAHGQYQGTPYLNRGVPSYNQPTYSPYLNLFNRNGGTLLQRYQGMVLPQVYYNQSINNINQQVATNQQSIANLGSQVLPDTGHPVLFNNYSHYFSGLRGSTSGMGGGQRFSGGGGSPVGSTGGYGGSGSSGTPSTGGRGGSARR